MGGAVIRAAAVAARPAAAAAGHAKCAAEAYKALPGATYGGGEEAGGLLSKSLASRPTRRAGSLLPGTVQASRPSREGTIFAVVIRGNAPLYPLGGDAMRTQLSHATQRRKR
jgi:hypothetical protein